MSMGSPDPNAWTMVDEGWGRKAVDFSTLSEPSNCREYVALHHFLGVDVGDRLPGCRHEVPLIGGHMATLAANSGASSGMEVAGAISCRASDTVSFIAEMNLLIGGGMIHGPGFIR